MKEIFKTHLPNIDSDKDGSITFDELRAWVGHLSAKEVMQAHETQVGLKDVDKDGDGNLSLEEVLNDLELQIGYDCYFELF